jgi:hypothetical protein
MQQAVERFAREYAIVIAKLLAEVQVEQPITSFQGHFAIFVA